MLNVESMQIGDIILRAHEETIELIGSINLVRADEYLKPFFEEVTKSIVVNQMKTVKVNVGKLMHINSSGIKVFSSWIMHQRELPDHQKFKIVFQCNATMAWQKKTFTVLVWLNQKFISIEELEND